MASGTSHTGADRRLIDQESSIVRKGPNVENQDPFDHSSITQKNPDFAAGFGVRKAWTDPPPKTTPTSEGDTFSQRTNAQKSSGFLEGDKFPSEATGFQQGARSNPVGAQRQYSRASIHWRQTLIAAAASPRMCRVTDFGLPSYQRGARRQA